MPTHAELSSKLLVDAAGFFKNLGEQNAELKPQMEENAAVFEQLSGLMIQDPQGAMNGTPNAELVGKVLKDAANFFIALAEQNEPIKDQMLENANVYIQIADLVSQDPMGVLD
ncbi:MAG: hypothetical protein CMH26_04655 [Micavibrio sp.]|nr:hypothetical protein [Micavibrio sp.]|tara:strand:+ start:1602 stop:1940 length:339 start_codon:yes stop_codon:yes gene_type:complete